jgi:hypothetical protein
MSRRTNSSTVELHGVMLYFDNCEVVHHLSDEDAGKIFKAIAEYVCEQQLPKLEGALMSLFFVFKNQIDRNRKNYEELCERNREKAQNHWKTVKKQAVATKIDQDEPEHTTVCSGMPQHTDVCLNNLNPNDNTNIINNSIDVLSEFEDMDDLSFEHLWDIYGKKEGNIESLRTIWLNLPVEERRKAMAFVPLYVASTPDVQFRKYLINYLKQRTWETNPITIYENETKTDSHNRPNSQQRRDEGRMEALSIMQEFFEEQ